MVASRQHNNNNNNIIKLQDRPLVHSDSEGTNPSSSRTTYFSMSSRFVIL